MIDYSIAQKLQDGVHNQEPKAIMMLYCELRHISDLKLRKYKVITQTRREEMSHDVASSLIMLYTKNPEYTIRSFSTRIDIEIKDKMTNGHKAHRKKGAAMLEMEDRSLSLDQIPDIPEENVNSEDQSNYLQDIINEDDGTKVILDIRWSNNYLEAIGTIRKYKTDQWIINNNSKLYHIYKLIRRKRNGKGTNHDNPGPGSKAKGAGELPSHRGVSFIGCQHATDSIQ